MYLQFKVRFIRTSHAVRYIFSFTSIYIRVTQQGTYLVLGTCAVWRVKELDWFNRQYFIRAEYIYDI